MPGRFRTGSRPLKTSIAAALYSLLMMTQAQDPGFSINPKTRINL
jgi:hypothetical protein